MLQSVNVILIYTNACGESDASVHSIHLK